MNSTTSARAIPRMPLWIAAAATVLLLGLPLEGSTIGRDHTERVFIVATLIVIGLAGAPGTTRTRARTLLNAAIALLGFTAALVLRGIAPSGAILLAIAIGSLVWQKRVWSAPAP